MKTTIFFLSLVLFAIRGFSQDSIRTRNDKPGTPQPLRTQNNAPKNKIHIIDTYKPPQQSIYHGATESNTIKRGDKTKTYPGITSANEIPETPAITIDNRTTRQSIHRDTAINKGTMDNGQSNATNPIRK